MKKLLAASIISAAVFLLFVIDPSLPGHRFEVVLKVASTGLLALMAATAPSPRKLLILALSASVLGDLLLEFKHLGPLGPVQLFLFGLISFLIAHLFYFALFVRERREKVAIARTIASLVVLGVAIVSLRTLWPGLAEMRMPVLAYSAILTLMAISAQRSRFAWPVAVGALLFVASDTMLALSIFGHPFAGSHVLVWITYYAAQAMLAVGVVQASASRNDRAAFVSIGA